MLRNIFFWTFHKFSKGCYTIKKTDQNFWATEIDKDYDENNITDYGGAISVFDDKNGLSGQFLVNVLKKKVKTLLLTSATLMILQTVKTVTHPHHKDSDIFGKYFC